MAHLALEGLTFFLGQGLATSQQDQQRDQGLNRAATAKHGDFPITINYSNAGRLVALRKSFLQSLISADLNQNDHCNGQRSLMHRLFSDLCSQAS
jgi:hypothetical protein